MSRPLELTFVLMTAINLTTSWLYESRGGPRRRLALPGPGKLSEVRLIWA